MSNGIWSASPASEEIRQSAYSRHRTLQVNCGSDLTTAWNTDDWSGMASLDPNSINPNQHNSVTDKGPEGGPHFVMSGETPDESHSYGFEFALINIGFAATPAMPDAGGYTVVVWELVSTTQFAGGIATPIWISFQTATGVGALEAWHSFDCNAAALRFQITNLVDDPTTHNQSIVIAFVEL